MSHAPAVKCKGVDKHGVRVELPIEAKKEIVSRLMEADCTEGSVWMNVLEHYPTEDLDSPSFQLVQLDTEHRTLRFYLIVLVAQVKTFYDCVMDIPGNQNAEELYMKLAAQLQTPIPTVVSGHGEDTLPGDSAIPHDPIPSPTGGAGGPMPETEEKVRGPYTDIATDPDSTRRDAVIVAIGSFWVDGKQGLTFPSMLADYIALLPEDMRVSSDQGRGLGMKALVNRGWLVSVTQDSHTKRWGLTEKGAARFKELTGKDAAVLPTPVVVPESKPKPSNPEDGKASVPATQDPPSPPAAAAERKRVVETQHSTMTLAEISRELAPYRKEVLRLGALDLERRSILTGFPPQARKAYKLFDQQQKEMQKAVYGDDE